MKYGRCERCGQFLAGVVTALVSETEKKKLCWRCRSVSSDGKEPSKTRRKRAETASERSRATRQAGPHARDVSKA